MVDVATYLVWARVRLNELYIYSEFKAKLLKLHKVVIMN